jgi:hypothetical protein
MATACSLPCNYRLQPRFSRAPVGEDRANAKKQLENRILAVLTTE